MEFPSIQQLFTGFTSVSRRFSIPVLFAVTGTFCALTLVDLNSDASSSEIYIKGIYLSVIGLCLSLAWRLFSESKKFDRSKFWLGNVFLLALISGTYFLFNPFLYETDIHQIGIIIFLVHLLVSISAFSKKEESNGFWQFNKLLFLRIFTSALYSGILFIGLTIALLAIDNLFNVQIKNELYLKLWIFIVGLFNTFFFLAGIKINLEGLNTEKEYPKALKVFTQYVLIPLSTIYLFILLAYELKITIAWVLPSGYVSSLILGYAVFGILSLLLVYPIRNREENKWINWFAKWFYLLLLPLLILLFLAIYKRVGDYGITEQRYILIALGIWLLFTVLYFLLKGTKNIRMIPLSLAALCLIMLVGPWNMADVSKSSQLNKLSVLLHKENPTGDDSERVRNIVRYLVDVHGLASLQSYSGKDLKLAELKVVSTSSNSYLVKSNLRDQAFSLLKPHLNKINIEPDDPYRYEPVTFLSSSSNILDVGNAQKIIYVDHAMGYAYNHIVRKLEVSGKQYEVSVNEKGKDILIAYEDTVDTIRCKAVFEKLLKKEYAQKDGGNKVYHAPVEDMILFKDIGGEQKVRVVFNQIVGDKNMEGELQSVEAFVVFEKIK